MLQDNKLHLAPVGRNKPIGRVLDCGTGTGVWAMDIGTSFTQRLSWHVVKGMSDTITSG